MTIQDSPWARFLGARADMIAELRSEGEGDSEICRTLSMDVGQVSLIAATPLERIVCTRAWEAAHRTPEAPSPQVGDGREVWVLDPKKLGVVRSLLATLERGHMYPRQTLPLAVASLVGRSVPEAPEPAKTWVKFRECTNCTQPADDAHAIRRDGLCEHCAERMLVESVACSRCAELAEQLRVSELRHGYALGHLEEILRQELAKASGWVLCSERMPPTGCSVIVDGGIAYFDGIDWRTLMDASHRKIEWKVTHWQPVPKLPAPPDSEAK